MVETAEVVIVGAGGGGAVLALALAQRGIRSVVLEHAPGPPVGLRGEIIQPNGQRILDQLGVLDQLPADSLQAVRYFHFCKARSREPLCTVDYGMLPPPYNRAIIALPNVAHRAILEALEKIAPGVVRFGAMVKRVLDNGRRTIRLEVEQEGRGTVIVTKLLVVADGAFSKVREALGLRAKVHRYRHGYLVALLDCPDGLREGRYFVGRGEILGLFPVAGRQVYLFEMIRDGTVEQVRAQGVKLRQEQWIAIDPTLERTFRTLVDWRQTAYLPTVRVRLESWVADGAVLIGDAAHAMNPHASQGRMQAMADAMLLAELIPAWLEKGDLSARTLREFEQRRRPQVEMLQRLADEEVILWNTGHPLLAWLRDRVFRTIGQNPRLSYQVLQAIAGMRERPPFSLLDRMMAVGLLPDPRADRLDHA
jgi:2-polyprenyl-6-methoxyphenol hydroxylase-like FAD-dependent oxidoreductase